MAHFAEIKQSDNIVIRVIVVSDNDLANNGGEYSTESETWVKNNKYFDKKESKIKTQINNWQKAREIINEQD